MKYIWGKYAQICVKMLKNTTITLCTPELIPKNLFSTRVDLQPDLYYFEAIKMTLQAQSKFTENTRLRLVFSIRNLTGLVTSFLWLQNGKNKAVS